IPRARLRGVLLMSVPLEDKRVFCLPPGVGEGVRALRSSAMRTEGGRHTAIGNWPRATAATTPQKENRPRPPRAVSLDHPIDTIQISPVPSGVQGRRTTP